MGGDSGNAGNTDDGKTDGDGKYFYNCGDPGHINPQCYLLKGERKALQAKNIAAKKAAGMDYKGKPSRTGNEKQPETKEGD